MEEEKTDLSSFDEIPDRVARARAKAEALRKARAEARKGAQAGTPKAGEPTEASRPGPPEETTAQEASAEGAAAPVGDGAPAESQPGAEGEADLASLDGISDRVARARAKAEAVRKARAGAGAGSPPPRSTEAPKAPVGKPCGAPARAAAARELTAEKGEGEAEQVIQKTPAPRAIRPGPPRTIPVAEGGITTRRGFLSWLTLAWVAFASATAVGLAAAGRFMFPNVLFEPPQSFKIGFPEEYEIGVDERWKKRYGVWIVRNTEGMYALIAVCTHLGCIPNWLATEAKFKCACHGTGFYPSGINFEGPAPRPLERVRIVLADDGQILVDKDRKYLYERGGWDQPESFLGI